MKINGDSGDDWKTEMKWPSHEALQLAKDHISIIATAPICD